MRMVLFRIETPLFGRVKIISYPNYMRYICTFYRYALAYSEMNYIETNQYENLMTFCQLNFKLAIQLSCSHSKQVKFSSIDKNRTVITKCDTANDKDTWFHSYAFHSAKKFRITCSSSKYFQMRSFLCDLKTLDLTKH